MEASVGASGKAEAGPGEDTAGDVDPGAGATSVTVPEHAASNRITGRSGRMFFMKHLSLSKVVHRL